jgi:hypothetical protein
MGEDEKLYAQCSGLWDRRATKGETVILAPRSSQNDWNEVASVDVLKGIIDIVPQVGSEPNDEPKDATPVAQHEMISQGGQVWCQGVLGSRSLHHFEALVLRREGSRQEPGKQESGSSHPEEELGHR